MIYREATEWGSTVLAQAGVAEAKLDAWLLLETVCRINRTFYYSHIEEALTLEQQSEYEIAVKKRESGFRCSTLQASRNLWD